VLGGLFGNQGLDDSRSELLLFITPRVVETEFDVKSVIDDLRRRMERLDEAFPEMKPPASVIPNVWPPHSWTGIRTPWRVPPAPVPDAGTAPPTSTEPPSVGPPPVAPR
jgi:hypothetical protein